jgi:hypothetical protein
MRDCVDRSGLEVTGEDILVDGWWTAARLSCQRTAAASRPRAATPATAEGTSGRLQIARARPQSRSEATLLGSEARSRQLLASNPLSTVARLGAATPSYGAI